MKEELNSKKILFTFFMMLGLTLLIFGASYAFFTYQKDGTKSVTMTSGSVKLHYEESSLKSINLTNALPMDDVRGKAQTDYFEFTITSETAGYDIPYYVASRVTTNEEDQIPASYISLYLTEVVNNSEVEVLDTTYDTLTNLSKNNHVEQQLILNTVQANTSNYEKTYRLRLWINETADYSPVEENGIQTYPMQDKEFNFIVNVYTEAEIQIERVIPGLYTMNDVLIEDWNELLTRGLIENNISNGRSIVDDALNDHNIEIGKLVLDDTVTSIASGTFAGYQKLGGIVISPSVEVINSGAFAMATELTNVLFEDNSQLKNIGDSAFLGCSSLTSISIPNSVTNIGTSAFEDDSNLSSVTIPTSLTVLNNNLFTNSGLTSISIPNNITIINEQVFKNCTELENVVFEDNSNLLNIGISAFENDNKLNQINIPNSLRGIEESAFSGCTSLANVTFEENSSISVISEYAFYNCSSLSSIIFPNSLYHIKDSAFSNNTSLTSVTFENVMGWYQNKVLLDVTNINTNNSFLLNGNELINTNYINIFANENNELCAVLDGKISCYQQPSQENGNEIKTQIETDFELYDRYYDSESGYINVYNFSSIKPNYDISLTFINGTCNVNLSHWCDWIRLTSSFGTCNFNSEEATCTYN